MKKLIDRRTTYISKTIYSKKIVVLTALFLFTGSLFFPMINGIPLVTNSEKINMINAPTLNGYNITVETDRYYFFPGDSVNFQGRLTENGTGFAGRVDFILIDPYDRLCFSGFTHTNSNGFFSIIYPLQINAILGIYNFTINYHGEPTVWAATSFEAIPCFHIENITGGINEVNAGITNDCGRDQNNIRWSITVTGGFFSRINKQTQGLISLLETNNTASIALNKSVLGIGPIHIIVTAQNILEYGFTREADGYIILFFIVCK